MKANSMYISPYRPNGLEKSSPFELEIEGSPQMEVEKDLIDANRASYLAMSKSVHSNMG